LHQSFNNLILKLFFVVRFNSKQNQARRSLVLPESEGTLAYPQCLRGNPSLSDQTIDAVVKFYLEDGISRISSNSKDTNQINKKTVAVRFMEISILDAFRVFNERFPDAVGRSTFNSPGRSVRTGSGRNLTEITGSWKQYSGPEYRRIFPVTSG
jgi:hypothetical protein